MRKNTHHKTTLKTAPDASHEPLFIILEHHLAHTQEPKLDRKTLVEIVLSDYLGFLRSHNITIPKSLEQATHNELAKQIMSILLKKIYGRHSISEYQKSIPSEQKRRVRSRYSKLPRPSEP